MKYLQKFEDFIGDLQTKNTRKLKKNQKDTEIILDPNTNDPERSYDDEDDGKDQINRHPIIF